MRPVPQVVPSSTGVPVSAQAGVPLQVLLPVWQAFAGVHATPTAQAAPTNPLEKWVTLAVAVAPLTVAGRTSHSVVLPGLVQ